MFMLSLSEFNVLPEGLQSAILLKEGIPLLWRPFADRQQMVLYSLGSFYVEVCWDRQWSMRHMRPFKNTDELSPYLGQINWHEFV